MIKKPPVSAKDIVIKKPTAANDAADVKKPSAALDANAKTDVLNEPAITVTAGNTKLSDSFEVPGGTDDPDAIVAPQGVESSSASSGQMIPDSEIKVTQDLTLHVPLLQATNGQAVLVLPGSGNRRCFLVGSRQANNLLRQRARRKSHILTRRELADINDNLQAIAEMEGASGEVFYRVAPVPGGIETDLGDEKNTRVRITAGKVEIVAAGSSTLFYRSPISMPMVRPAERGNLDLLDKYLNLNPADILLLKAWLSYTLGNPKLATTKFPILLLQGEQGAGKSFLCSIVQALTDPNSVGVQILPTNGKDLAIAAQNSHVLAYDNVRGFKQSMADLLCIASTGGALSSRMLYTDADQAIQRLHVALILNGMHDFINQPDLAQRCLPLHMEPLSPDGRKSEVQLKREFDADLPVIFRGLLDLMADVFAHLPSAEITNPERMIDYVRWLAAMEKADNVPAGTYQDVYSYALQQVQRDALLESPLAAAVLTFAEGMRTREWSGTPGQFLEELNLAAAPGTTNWRYWPDNPIALSKRLKPLLGGLREQGVDIQTSRGKERRITIMRMEGFKND